MISRLKGQLMDKRATAVTVMTGGVGYDVHIPLSTFYELPDEGREADFFIKTVVREDAIDLFGFLTEAEKTAFILLNGVSKIGPKLALNILSGIQPSELVQAVNQKNVARLSRVPGMGAKTAERLCLELKDKINLLAAMTPAAPPEPGLKELSMVEQDVISALVNLGYSKAEAEKTVAAVRDQADGGDIADILKRSLKKLQRH